MELNAIKPLMHAINRTKAPFIASKLEIGALKLLEPKITPLTEDTVQIGSKIKNTIRMERVSSYEHHFFEGEKYIGKAKISPPVEQTAIIGELPESWYIPNGVPNNINRLPTYPRLRVDEFVISDKTGLFDEYQQRSSGKKYGAMCMQRILEYAEQNGYGTRIYLSPAKHYSNIHPGKFYAKIGFEPGPQKIEFAQKENERCIQYLKKHQNLPEEIKKDYLDRTFYEQIDGRFISTEEFGGELYLTHPEVLRNYPL